MEKRALKLGGLIGLIFILASLMVMIVSYHAISLNFKKMFTEYSIQLVQSMIGQGVMLVETRLHDDLQKVNLAAERANSSPVNSAEELPVKELTDEYTLRVLYVSEAGVIASDGRSRNVYDRDDIKKAFAGQLGTYGPYYNEEGEYVISYSAPVKAGNKVIGVLCLEKNGYFLCDLIKHIKFAQSGECYIINSEGTDIAVSRLEHIEWVTEQYNGQKLLEENEDPVTRKIVELEAKGLRGETGHGTYFWDGGRAYVAYEPIPSQSWVILGGLREDEIVSMTKSAIFASLSDNRILQVSLIVFVLLTFLIVYWIIESLHKNAKINRNLEKIANMDALTGLFNRRYLETDIENRWKYPIKISGNAAIYMLDIDNFKMYNDSFGHQAGDECLRRVSAVFRDTCNKSDGYVVRYGGEEFLAVVFKIERSEALKLGQDICLNVVDEKLSAPSGGFVTVSVGVCYVDNIAVSQLNESIKLADKALYMAKLQGKNRAVMYEPDKMKTADTVSFKN